jgi:hypothetical protein
MNSGKALYFITSALAACFFACLPLSAQPRPKPKPQQAITFFVFGPSENGTEFFCEDGRGGALDIQMTDGSSAGPLIRDQTEELVLWRVVPPTREQIAAAEAKRALGGIYTPPQPTRVVAAKTRLPANAVNVLIVVSCAGETIRGVQAFDQSLSVLPAGNIGLRNLTSFEAALRLGANEARVPAAGQALVPVVTRTGKSATMRVQFAVLRDGEWQMGEEGATVVNPNRRRLGLIVPGGAAGARVLLMPPAVDDPTQPEPVLAQR